MASRMFPKLHIANLAQLKAVLKHPKVKAAYIHGDGNIYHTKKMSDDRAIFHNDHPTNRGATYRAEFTDPRDVPDTLEELEQMLIEAYQREESDKIKDTYNANDNNFVFSVDENQPIVEIKNESTPLVSLPDPSIKVTDPADIEKSLTGAKKKAKKAEGEVEQTTVATQDPGANAGAQDGQ